MTIFIGSEEKRVGLALSGGGFRAAAFHLGAFRKLHQLGLLWKLDLLTCVSGGSIAGAFLACHWGEDDALDKLENYLRTRSIAVSSFIGGALDPFHSRLDKLADSYERDLYGRRTLGSLQNGPRLYLNSTNLATGNMFSFRRRRPSCKADGEWGTRSNEAAASPSVTPRASPAFPQYSRRSGSISPVPGGRVDYVTLADGGSTTTLASIAVPSAMPSTT
jgi:NTE family protein